MTSKGIVYLVGAGPGDPQLLTLRGAELLRRAEVVVLDALVNPDLLALVPPGAEVIRRTEEKPLAQAAVNALLLERARAGRCVVRLKGGDPYVFGRGGEEASALAAAGVRFEVVPGVSSITAVPNYGGVPLTHRDHCSSFTVMTGHEDPTDPGSRLDWQSIAREPGTKVVLMGARRMAALVGTLREAGLAARTPVAVIQWGTTGRQRSVSGTLADIVERVEKAGLSAPALTIIGDVVAERARLNWFESRPLFGRRVVVTRARDQAADMVRALQERGADVLQVPCLRFAPPAEHRALVEAIAGLGEYDWIVFSSPNGVKWFFDAFFKAFNDLRDIGGVRFAAVGPATAARLRQLHLQVDVMPRKYLGKEIVRALSAFEDIENRRVLLLRAEVANPELPRLLEEKGAMVDDVACYQTVVDTDDWNGHAARLVAEGADWLTFASGSGVRGFHTRFNLPALLDRFPGMRVASIGPETSQALATLALKPAVEAKVHTVDGLIAALEAAGRRKASK